MKKLLLFVFIIAATATFSQQINTQKLDSFFNILNQNKKAMGSAAISKNGKLLYSKAIGFIDSGKTIPANIETKYRIGSITKMFTAVCIFQLIEQRKISLETRLSKYFRQIPNADKITVAQMLHHSSGIYNITDDSLYSDWCTKPITQEQMVARITKYSSAFEPDAKVEYSNSNYILLGYIIEKITGKSYSENITERIIKKPGLNKTGYGSKINNKNNDANSFAFMGNEYKNFELETDMSVPGAAGAIVSTPADLTFFIQSLFNYKLVSKTSLDKMMNIKSGMGMGMFIFPFYNKTAYGHNGGIDGFNSSLAYFPKDSVAVCYISNGINYPLNDILIGLLSIYFDKKYSLPDFAMPAKIDIDVMKFIGTYSSAILPIKISITTDGKSLTAQATGQSSFPLEYKGGYIFTFDTAGIELEFNTDKNEMILKQGGGNFTFKKEK